jgi:hypothetical protein
MYIIIARGVWLLISFCVWEQHNRSERSRRERGSQGKKPNGDSLKTGTIKRSLRWEGGRGHWHGVGEREEGN